MSLYLGGHLLWMCGLFTLESGKKEIALKLKNGEALEKFQEMLKAQGVSADVARSLCSDKTDYFRHMTRAAYQTELKVLDNGNYVPCSRLRIKYVNYFT